MASSLRRKIQQFLVAPFLRACLVRGEKDPQEGEERWILPGFLRHFARPEANWPESRVAFPSSGSRHYGRLAREPPDQWERESMRSVFLAPSSFLRPDSARSDAIKTRSTARQTCPVIARRGSFLIHFRRGGVRKSTRIRESRRREAERKRINCVMNDPLER